MGMVRYAEALRLQESLHAARVESLIPDTLLLLQHHDVFTLGRNADDANFLTPKGVLKSEGFDIERTGRGGDITYHGPGQLIGYPIISLRDGGYSVTDYVHAVEESLVNMLKVYGLVGERDDRNRGVWIGNNKIAAIGLRISRGVAMHGFALNVSTDLEKYTNIVPCGISDGGVTSMRNSGCEAEIVDVSDEVVKAFASELGYQEVECVERRDIEKARLA